MPGSISGRKELLSAGHSSDGTQRHRDGPPWRALSEHKQQPCPEPCVISGRHLGPCRVITYRNHTALMAPCRGTQLLRHLLRCLGPQPLSPGGSVGVGGPSSQLRTQGGNCEVKERVSCLNKIQMCWFHYQLLLPSIRPGHFDKYILHFPQRVRG